MKQVRTPTSRRYAVGRSRPRTSTSLSRRPCMPPPRGSTSSRPSPSGSASASRWPGGRRSSRPCAGMRSARRSGCAVSGAGLRRRGGAARTRARAGRPLSGELDGARHVERQPRDGWLLGARPAGRRPGRSTRPAGLGARDRRQPAALGAADGGPVMAPRDGQRAKVYDAEHLVHRIFDRSEKYPTVDVAGSRLTLPVERRFASSTRCRTTWTACWRSAGSAPNGRGPPCRCGSASGSATRRRTTSAPPPSSQSPVTARTRRGHCASWWCCTSSPTISPTIRDRAEPQHGGEFVDRLLILVDGVVGPEAALLLRVTMLESGVAVA